MIFGAHVVVYSKDATADRTFFREVLGFSSVDAGHGKQQGHNCGFNYDVRQHQGLHQRINDGGTNGNIGKDGSGATSFVSKREQQNVGRGLENGDTDYLVDKVLARDDAVKSPEKYPCGNGVWQIGQDHGLFLRRSSMISFK